MTSSHMHYFTLEQRESLRRALEQRAGELERHKAKPVIVCCNTGMTSAKAASSLRKSGRQDVFNLDGGLNAWRQAGLPVVKN